MRYAVINKETNLVTNIIISDDKSNIFLNSDEYAVLATRSTTIGNVYDKFTETFPEIVEIDDKLDYIDEVDELKNEVIIPLPIHLLEEDRELFVKYYNTLNSLYALNPSEGRTELQNLNKPNLDLLIPPQDGEILPEN